MAVLRDVNCRKGVWRGAQGEVRKLLPVLFRADHQLAASSDERRMQTLTEQQRGVHWLVEGARVDARSVGDHSDVPMPPAALAAYEGRSHLLLTIRNLQIPTLQRSGRPLNAAG